LRSRRVPFTRSFSGCMIAGFALATLAAAQTASFHHAPAAAAVSKNPFTGEENAKTGRDLYLHNCSTCHGQNAEGMANIAALATGPTQTAKPGEIFWYISRGNKAAGMPSWKALPAEQRWQIISYLKILPTPEAARLAAARPAETASTAAINAPPPTPPFTDFRYEKPGTMRKITAADLPAPYATNSAGNGPRIVPRPKDSWPQVPAGFKVDLYATGLDNPRLIRTAPNGDMFVAESEPGRILIFRGVTPDGKPQITGEFATGLDHPFGIAFYPLGPDPRWVYIGDTNAVVRFPERRPGGAWAGGACGRPAQQRPRPLDARRAVLAGRADDVCGGGLRLERRRSGHDTRRASARQYPGLQS